MQTQMDAACQITLKELMSLRQHARNLPFHARQRGQSLSGVRLSQHLGGGLEFEQVRAYQHGDDLSCMDWKVTARTNKPHVKEFRQERERPVVILVDQRPSMFFGTRIAFKSVVAAKLAGLAAWLAIDNGERLGSCVVSADQCQRLPVKSGLNTVLQFFNQMTALSIPKSYGNQFDFNDALQQCQVLLQNRCLFVILSDFSGINNESTALLKQCSTHSQVVACFIYDTAEKNPPPPGLYPISDGHEEAVLNLQSKSCQEAYRKRFADHFQHVRNACRQSQIPLHSLNTQQDMMASPLVHWLCQLA